ncbi:unnamed protein product [Prorocentrum cordatum]|uniref:Pentatricopeptide repeat-containing protein n=1 Tax=Prorocentrum cordatum TaxID=2364126 RepID=A0ABN9QMQ1_9DINO|nr:unnamed protein product [Polarella glacialis]
MVKTKLEPTVISYRAWISACEKGQQWQRALSLLSEMVETKLKPAAISYNAWISPCGKGQQWQRALSLLSWIVETKLDPDTIIYNAWISACGEVSSSSRPCRCSARCSRRRWIPFSSAIVLG